MTRRAVYAAVVMAALLAAVLAAGRLRAHGDAAQRSFVPPARIRQAMRTAIGEYGTPRVVFAGIRRAPYADSSRTPLYGFLVEGRFVVVGPAPSRGPNNRTIYDRGEVIVDSTGLPVRVGLWSSNSPHAAADASRLRRNFASTT